jgi:hypothetical protein
MFFSGRVFPKKNVLIEGIVYGGKKNRVKNNTNIILGGCKKDETFLIPGNRVDPGIQHNHFRV